MFKRKAAVFIFLLSLSLFACAAPSKYYQSSMGEVHPGMSQEAVKAELGVAAGFHRRQISPDDLREIWIYAVQDRDLLKNHLYPKRHLIVFSNGVMLAKNPHNPYAPRDQF